MGESMRQSPDFAPRIDRAVVHWADEAMRFMKGPDKYKFTSAIWMAVNHLAEPDRRSAYYKVLGELNRRRALKGKLSAQHTPDSALLNDQADRIIDAFRQERFLDDAIKNQALHPRSAWDNSHDAQD